MNSSFSVEDDASSSFEEDFAEGFDEKADNSNNVVLVLSEDEVDFDNSQEGRPVPPGEPFVPVVVGSVPLYMAEGGDGKPVYIRQMPQEPPDHKGTSNNNSDDDDSSFGGFSDNSESTFEGFGPVMFEGFTDEETGDSDDSQFDGFSEGSAEAVEGKQKIEYIRKWQKTSKCFNDLGVDVEDSNDSLPDLSRRPSTSKRSRPRPVSKESKNVSSQLSGPSHSKGRKKFSPRDKPSADGQQNKPVLGLGMHSNSSPSAVIYEGKGKQQCLVIAPQLRSKDIQTRNEKDVSSRFRGGREKTDRTYVSPNVEEDIEVKEEANHLYEDEDLIGPYCSNVGCTISWLESMTTKNVPIVNGIVYELSEFAKKINWEQSDVAKWILRLHGVVDVEPTEADISKIRSVMKRRKALMVTLAGNKRGHLKLQEFDAVEFILPAFIKKESDEAESVAWNVREHDNKRKGRHILEGCPLPSKRNRSSSVDVLSYRHGMVSKEKEGVSVESRVRSGRSKRGRRRSHLDTGATDSTSNTLKKLKKSDSRVSFQCRENSVYPHFTETDECLGKHSKKANLTINDLNSCDEKDIQLTNGLVIELCRFYRDRGCTVTSLAQRLLQLKNLNSLNLVSLVVKITKLVQKSHHPVAFIEEEFLFPRPKTDDLSKSRIRGLLLKSKAKQVLPDHPIEEQRNQQSSVESTMSKNIVDEKLVKSDDNDVLKDDDSRNIKHEKEMETTVDQIKPKIDVEEKAVEEVVMDKEVGKVDSPKKGGSCSVSRKPDLDANQDDAGDTSEENPERETVLENDKELKHVTDKTRELELQNKIPRTPDQDDKLSLTNLIISPNKTNEDECHKEETVFENKNKVSLADAERTEAILGEKGSDLEVKAESLNERNKAAGNGEEVTDIEKQKHSGNDYETNGQDDDFQSLGRCSHNENYLSDENDSSTSEVAGSSREILSEGEENENKPSPDEVRQNCQEVKFVQNDKMVNETFNEDVKDKIIEAHKCKSEENIEDIYIKNEQGWNESVISNIGQAIEAPYTERDIRYSDSQLHSASNRASKEKDSGKLKHLEGKPCEVRRSERERTLSVRVKEYHSVSEFYDEPTPHVSPKKLKLNKSYEKLQDNYKQPTASFSGKSQKRVTNGMALEFLARKDPRVSFSICDGRITPHFNDINYYLGEHCDAAGLTVEDLNNQEPKDVYLTRGAVVELIKFYKLMGCTMTSLADRLLRLKMIYLDSILNLVARFQPLMRQEGNFARMREEFIFPPGQHNVLKRTPNRKNPKTKNKTDSLRKLKKEKAPTYTCEVIFKPKKKKKKKRETDASSENVVNIKKLSDFKKKKKQFSEVDVSKVHGQVVVDKEVEKARGKEGSVTRADIVLLYANWLNNKHKTGNNVFVTDLLQDVMKLMEDRKVQTIRIPAGTLMSSSVKLYEEYRQMWSTNKADAMMYLEDDWLEDIQYLVSITQTSRRNTMEMSEGDGSVTDDNRPTAARNFEEGEREFSDSSSERSLKIDESYFSSDEDLKDFETQEKSKKMIRQQQNAKYGASIKMLINRSKSKKKSLPYSQVIASSSSELQEKSKWSKRHEIDEIIDYRCTLDENSKKQVSYLVHRKGFGPHKAIWVDETQLRCPKNLKGYLKDGRLSRKPQDKLIWQQPTFQQTVGFPIKLNTCEGLRVADDASVSEAGNAFHDEVNDKENSPHNLCNVKYNTDKGYMTNGELLHMYDCWRQDNVKISSTKNLIDIQTFTEKVEETMQNYGIKTNYSEYLLQACFTLTLICRMLSSEEALKEFLDKDCLPALESSKANQENNTKISGSSKIGGLSANVLKMKSQFREMKGKRSANQVRVHVIEDEVEKLERSLDIAQGQTELLSGALNQEINRLSKKLTKLSQEEDIPLAKEFQSENPERYEKACQDILECGVPERNVESIMNSVLQVIGRFSADAKKASDK